MRPIRNEISGSEAGKTFIERSIERLSSKENRLLSPALNHILSEVQRELSAFSTSQYDDVARTIDQVAAKLGFELATVERDALLKILEGEEKPFGVLQTIVDDPRVSDVIVSNYSTVSLQMGRSNYACDIKFPNNDFYESYVERLLYRAGTSYSTRKPIADGMIGDFARIHAVHRSICESGPYLTIRLNRFNAVSTKDLGSVGLAPFAVLRYLEKLVRVGSTVLISGEVGTGKTTLARALATSLPREESILVIEDTPEIKVDHPHVRYIRTREANSDDAGRISPSLCIRGGMRMAMNRIIFGEIRDSEAAEAFIDVCASGHPGLSTIHARSPSETLSRLELFLGRVQRGVSQRVIREQISTAVHVVVHVDVCKKSGKRRIISVAEIGNVADGPIQQREIFNYSHKNGSAEWRCINKVSCYRELLESGDSPYHLNELPTVLSEYSDWDSDQGEV